MASSESQNARVTLEELHAYVDAALPPERRPAVEAWLSANPDDARRVADYRTLNIALHRLLTDGEGRPTPPAIARDAALLADRLAQRTRLRRAAFGGSALAATVAIVAFGVGALNLDLDALRRGPTDVVSVFAANASEAHRLFAYEQSVDGPGGIDARRAVGWLSTRVDGAPATAPDLDGLGYGLVGGRIFDTGAGPAVQLRYEDASGGRVTLYMGRVAAGARSQLHEAALAPGGGYRGGAYVWLAGDIAFGLIGPLPEPRLHEIARTVGDVIAMRATPSAAPAPAPVPEAGVAEAPPVVGGPLGVSGDRPVATTATAGGEAKLEPATDVRETAPAPALRQEPDVVAPATTIPAADAAKGA